MTVAAEVSRLLSDARRYWVEIPGLNVSSIYAWLAELAERYPDLASQFRAAFVALGSDDGNKPRIIVGLGTQLEIQAEISPGGLTTRTIDSWGRVIGTEQHVEFNSESGQLPADFYQRLFDTVARAAFTLADMPMLGGWCCLPRVGGQQVVCRFTVPRILIRGAGHGLEVISSTGRVDLPHPERWIHQPACQPQPTSARELIPIPDAATYRANLATALDELRTEQLTKVVIARKLRLQLDREPAPLELAALVSAHHLQQYSYSFRWGDGPEWIGVSPEILLRKRGLRMMTAPLAGTKPVSDDPVTEAATRAELMSDRKENIEHRYAVSHLVDGLKRFCGDSLRHAMSRAPIRTRYAYHIKTEITGQVSPSVTAFDLLGAIYPPATIWGLPHVGAARTLARVEPFDREYFAGGFGYVAGPDDAELALAIRTARLDGTQLDVFAGSGIVAQSRIEREFEETVVKMTPFLDATGRARARR